MSATYSIETVFSPAGCPEFGVVMDDGARRTIVRVCRTEAAAEKAVASFSRRERRAAEKAAKRGEG